MTTQLGTVTPAPPEPRSRTRTLATGLTVLGATTVGAGLPALVTIPMDGPPDLPATSSTFVVFAVAGGVTLLLGLALLPSARPLTAMQRRTLLLVPVVAVMLGSVLGVFLRFIPLPAMWYAAAAAFVLGLGSVHHAARDRSGVPAGTAGGSRFNALVMWVLDLPRQVKLALAFGAAILAEIGIALAGFLTEPKAGAATCEGKQMYPGDLCQIYEEPAHVLVDTKTYDEMLADVATGNTIVGWVAVVALVVTVIVAAAQVVSARRAGTRRAG